MKTKTSNYTKHIKRKLTLYRFLNYALLLTPLLIYVIIAIADDGVVVSGKVAVVGSVMAAIILTVFNIIAKAHLTCMKWIVFLGLFVAVREILLPLVIILAVVSCLDDLIFSPLIKKYKTKLIAAQTIDEREEFEK